MAQKRMFDKTITNSDEFLDMPDSSQNLYFHLSMNADDDGFVNNWKSIMRMTGHKQDDLKVLTAKQFIIPFDSGVIVIRHWRINNYLRNDRYVETKFKDEKSKLSLDDNLVYQLDTNGRHSIDKNRIVKNSIEEKEIYKEKESKKSKKPTLEEIKEYCLERDNNINAEQFLDYYEANGWVQGKGKPIKDWKACIRTWERNKVNQPKESRYERERRLLKEMLVDEED